MFFGICSKVSVEPSFHIQAGRLGPPNRGTYGPEYTASYLRTVIYFLCVILCKLCKEPTNVRSYPTFVLMFELENCRMNFDGIILV